MIRECCIGRMAGLDFRVWVQRKNDFIIYCLLIVGALPINLFEGRGSRLIKMFIESKAGKETDSILAQLVALGE